MTIATDMRAHASAEYARLLWPADNKPEWRVGRPALHALAACGDDATTLDRWGHPDTFLGLSISIVEGINGWELAHG